MRIEQQASNYVEVDSMPFLTQLLGQIDRRQFNHSGVLKSRYPMQRQPLRPVRAAHKLNAEQAKSVLQYEIWGLKLSPGFDVAELKQAFRRLALKLHPDHSKSSSDDFLLLKAHHEVLLGIAYA